MNTWTIKGQCEYCGFAFKGTISSKETFFPAIKCPTCHEETQNFDENHAINAINKYEGTILDYKESQLEVVG